VKAPALILAALAIELAGCGEAPALPANTVTWKAAPEFPALTGRVVDQANLLSPADEQRLTAELAAVEREVGPQFVIVTVNSLQDRPILDYAVQLGRHWGIGHRGRNDGVILLVAPAERQVRIEVGYGLERRVTDPFAARVIREQMAPRFRQSDVAGAINAGSDAIIARLRSRQSDSQIAAEDHLVS